MPYKKIGCLNKRENNDTLIRKDKTVQRYIKRSSNLSKENQVKRYNQSKSELTPEVDNVTIYTIPKKGKTKLLKELSDSIRLLENYINDADMKIYNIPNQLTNDVDVQLYIPQKKIKIYEPQTKVKK